MAPVPFPTSYLTEGLAEASQVALAGPVSAGPTPVSISSMQRTLPRICGHLAVTARMKRNAGSQAKGAVRRIVMGQPAISVE